MAAKKAAIAKAVEGDSRPHAAPTSEGREACRAQSLRAAAECALGRAQARHTLAAESPSRERSHVSVVAREGNALQRSKTKLLHLFFDTVLKPIPGWP